MQSTVLVALALAQASALLAPRAPALRGVSLCSTPPELSYAADKAKDAPEEEQETPQERQMHVFVASERSGGARCLVS